MTKYIWILLLILFPKFVLAQGDIIEGTVYSQGEPLMGVTIAVKGATIGTVSDIDGRFFITIPSSFSSPALVFSYIGFVTKTVNVKDQNRITVELQEDDKTLDEVVVVAYGTQKKSDLTSAISVVNAKEISKLPVTDLAQAMQGRAAGVTITSSGQPGGGARIRIRGTGTVNSTDPLIVVDGVPGAPMPDANDTESIQILKDAATCALYGSRGSNGVVMITTKKGTKGKTRVEYSGTYGMQWVHNMISLLSPDEYIQYHQENQMYNNLGGVFNNGWVSLSPRIVQAIADPTSYTPTDWLNELYQNADMTKHNISVSGGGENNTFFVSGGFVNQDGVQVGSGYRRFTLQVNNTATLGIFRVGQNLNLFARSSLNNSSAIESALRCSPLAPMYNTNNIGGFDGPTDAMDLINPGNPIASIRLNPYNSMGQGLSGNVFAEIDIFKKFTYRANLGIKSNWGRSRGVNIKSNYGVVSVPNSSLAIGYNNSYSTVVENTLTYKNSFGRHNLNAMVGYTTEYEQWENTSVSGDKFNVDNPISFGTIATDAITAASGGFGENAYVSFLARVIYDYKGRYLFTGNFRRDGSAKFGPNNKYGNFPSFSLGWRISEEAFFEPLRSVVDNLKIRGSWGIIGSDFGVGIYSQEENLSQGSKYLFGGVIAPGTTINSLVNRDLCWEEQTTTDIGIDADFFNGQLSFVADYYQKQTNGMLIWVPKSSSSGINGRGMTMNAGNVRNRGLELSLTARKTRGNFLCDVTLNTSFERNLVTHLGDINQPIIGGNTYQFPEGITKTEVGHSIGEFYGYKMLGIYQIGDSDIPEGLAPGDIRYDDMIDGNAGLSDSDRTYLGSPFPNMTYNFGFNAAYKGFDFSIFFQGVAGNSIFHENRYWLEGMKDFQQQGSQVKERWTPENPSNTMPRANQGSTHNLKISSRFVEDGSYLRLKSLSFGYNFPLTWCQKIEAQKIRLYVSGQNLWTLTRYSGLDPEISNGGGLDWQKGNNLYNGIDRSNYPVAASAFVGVEIGF